MRKQRESLSKTTSVPVLPRIKPKSKFDHIRSYAPCNKIIAKIGLNDHFYNPITKYQSENKSKIAQALRSISPDPDKLQLTTDKLEEIEVHPTTSPTRSSPIKNKTAEYLEGVL
jgi:hypothetical protein